MTGEPAKPTTESPKPTNPVSPVVSQKSSLRLKKIFGRLFGISAVLTALALSFLTWWELDIRPRTDDAYLRANIVGIAANVSGYITELAVVDNQKVSVMSVRIKPNSILRLRILGMSISKFKR